MSRHHVWIASHFHNQYRYKLFEETVKSIASQTLKPEIVVLSFSVQFDVKINIEELFDLHFTPNNITYIILAQPERLHQFQHLRRIHNHFVSLNTTDIVITFCDDDDMLHKERIEQVEQVIHEHNIVCCFFTLIDENQTFDNIIENKLMLQERSEFGCFSCKFHIMTEFLETDFGFEIDKKTEDVYFMAFYRDAYKMKRSLYYHRRMYYNHYNMNIWKIPLEKTQSEEFISLVNKIQIYLHTIQGYTKIFVCETDGVEYLLQNKEEIKQFIISRWFHYKGHTTIDSFIDKQLHFIKVLN